MPQPQTAREEWKRHWLLPFIAAAGYSTASMHSYGIGVFVEPLEAEFGWTRAFISMGLTISGLTGALLAVPMGALVDRYGPRRIGMIGVVLMVSAFGLLGTATGTVVNWIMLWAIIALCNPWSGAVAWTKAVASRFEKSRGLAFAVTLSGAPITTTLIPLIATAVMLGYGWRAGFFGVALAWAVVVWPLVFLFFRSAHEDRQQPAHEQNGAAPVAELPGLALRQALRTFDFYKLLLVSAFFAFTVVGTTVHFVPILIDGGSTPLAAAGIASLIGIFSFFGRLGTGFLLDRVPTNLLGGAICTLPAISCALLLLRGDDPVFQSIAAALLGLTVGGEIDVIAYLTTRQFGLKNYGTVYGAMTGAMQIGTATGAVLAGAIYDAQGSYTIFLFITIAAMLTSSLSLLTIVRKPFAASH
ncbi:MAG: MFS transporter [Novosphingobium sp.]|nr:MFS transporter [Novosphingobium sp.]